MSQLQVQPMSSHVGSEVTGIQIKSASDDEIGAIKAVLAERGLVVFRDQDLSETDHIAFARRIGPIVVNNDFPANGGHAEIAEVRKAETQLTNIGGGWHTDHSYDQEPAMGSILLAREVPEEDCFRDQVLEVCPSCRNIGGLQRTLEGSSLETIRHMVATGLGVTVLPSSAADELSNQNQLVAVRPFSAPEPSRRVALAWRVTYPRSGAIDVLRTAILDSALPGVRPVGRGRP